MWDQVCCPQACWPASQQTCLDAVSPAHDAPHTLLLSTELWVSSLLILATCGLASWTCAHPPWLPPACLSCLQTAFNDIVRQGATASVEDGTFKGYHGNLTVGILPVAQFASGHVFFVQVGGTAGGWGPIDAPASANHRTDCLFVQVAAAIQRLILGTAPWEAASSCSVPPPPCRPCPMQRKHEEFGLEPYVAHATFQYSGTPGKRHRFREAMLFEDPRSYYDDPRGFIHLRVDIPQTLLERASGGSDRCGLAGWPDPSATNSKQVKGVVS